MAVTAIWDIKGRIDKVIDYAANPDKTENKTLKSISALHAIDGVLEYTANDIKTEMKFYVSGINCDPDFASRQFMNTKRNFNKTGGIVAFHGYQSFRENEVNAEIAHEVGIKLAERLWGDRFEVIVATHLNTGHFHNHFVLNSVSYKDGLKYYDQKKTYYEMRKTSDELCKDYGLSVIENPQNGSKNYGEWIAEKNGKPTVRGKIREQIDFAVSQSTTTKHFWSVIKKLYLDPFMDMYNSEIISYSISQKPSAGGIMTALTQAIEATDDCKYRRTFHSDQGWAYQMKAYVKTLKDNKIFQSMSRKGNCHDNSVMENFFGILKQELYYGQTYYSFDQLKTAIQSYIKYYNNKRTKQKLGYLSPVEYRLKYQAS